MTPGLRPRAQARRSTGNWLCGGSILAGELLDEIDALILEIYPVMIGSGRPLVDRPFEPRAFNVDR